MPKSSMTFGAWMRTSARIWLKRSWMATASFMSSSLGSPGSSQICESSLHVLFCLTWTQPDLWVQSPCFVSMFCSVSPGPSQICESCLKGKGVSHNCCTQPDLWLQSLDRWGPCSSMFVVSHNCCTQPDLWVQSLDMWGPCSSMFVVSHNCCTQPDLWVQSLDGWGPCSSMFVVSHADPARSPSPVCGWGHAPSYLFCLRTHVHSLMYVTGSM